MTSPAPAEGNLQRGRPPVGERAAARRRRPRPVIGSLDRARSVEAWRSAGPSRSSTPSFSVPAAPDRAFASDPSRALSREERRARVRRVWASAANDRDVALRPVDSRGCPCTAAIGGQAASDDQISGLCSIVASLPRSCPWTCGGCASAEELASQLGFVRRKSGRAGNTRGVDRGRRFGGSGSLPGRPAQSGGSTVSGPPVPDV
jgi:hypothetical protein